MRRLFLFALLLGAWAALGQDRNRRTLGRNQTNSSTQLLSFAPASGAGLPSVADLCDTYSSEMTGAFICMRGDGTVLNGSQALNAVNAPTTDTSAVCPNGQDCTSASSQRFNGSNQAYQTANAAGPTGNFSICATVNNESVALNSVPIGKDDLVTRVLQLKQASNAAMVFSVFKAGGASSFAISSAGGDAIQSAWLFVCGTYQYVADGSSILIAYNNGVAGTPNTTGVGPPATGSSKFDIADQGNGAGSFFKGRIRNVFYTEKTLTPAVVAAMARTAMADQPTGTRGETLTFTRSSTKFCVNSTGSAGSWLPVNRPCIANGGIHIEGPSTNLAIRSDAFDHAAWTKTNVTVTADSTAAPDGTIMGDTLQSTVNGGLAESTAAAITGTVGTASVYLKTTVGTQAINIILRDTTAGADRCTGSGTATTTWQRFTCSSASITTTNNHTVRVYPGGTAGQGTVIGWGAQMEANAFVTSYINTAGTSVTRAAEAASMSTPGAMSNTAGCVAASAFAPFIASLSFPGMVSFSGGASPGTALALQSFKDFVGNDAINSAGVSETVLDARTSSIFVRFWWSSAGIQLGSPNATGGLNTSYDGTEIGTSFYLGSAAGGASGWMYGTLKDVRMGTGTGACQ